MINATPSPNHHVLPFPNCLMLSKTTHVRVHPRRHGFSYPMLHLGVDLDDLVSNRITTQSFGLIGYNQYRPLAIWDKDYLFSNKDGFPRPSIRTKLERILLQQANIQASEQVGRVFMVTSPRFLNYAFNPLTIYYCYGKSTSVDVIAVVLEVSNTFGERHIYICDPTHNGSHLPVPNLKEYTHAFTVARAFHVSPFNTRKGVYHVYTKIPDVSHSIDLQLIMEVPKQGHDPKDMQRILSADIRSTSSLSLDQITHINLSIHVLKYFGTIFLTMPRIMYQAFQLSYFKKLWVYDRPPILRSESYAQNQIPVQLSMGHARTIRALPKSRLAKHVRAILCTPDSVWAQAANLLDITLVIFDNDPTTSPITLGAESTGVEVQVVVLEFQVWESMALLNSPVQGIIYSYVKGDLHTSNLSKLIQVAEHAAQSLEPKLFFTSTLIRWARRLGRLFNKSSNKVPTILPNSGKFHTYASIEMHYDTETRIEWHIPLQMAVLILYTLLIRSVMQQYFIRLAKFAWSSLEFDARLCAYVLSNEKGSVTIPAECVDCDFQAVAFAQEARDDEFMRWEQCQEMH